ncbi:MAG: PKD domain-containing protein [Chitinophagaceae bacterium]
MAQLQANFTVNNASGCSPLTVAFTNTTTGASANAVWEWNLGNGANSNRRNPSAIYYDEQIYTVTLTVKDGGQTSTKSATITVYKKPQVDFSVLPQRGCAPFNVTFNSSATPGDGTITDYFWDFGDGTTDQGLDKQSISHTYTFAQKPPVKLTVTNSFGCYTTAEKSNILEVVQGLKIDFNADNPTLCQLPDAVTFNGNATGPGTLSYDWDFGNGQTATGKNPAPVSYTQKGLYTVKLKVTSTEGCTDSLVKTAFVNAANFNSDFTAPPVVCTASPAALTNSSTPQPTQSIWKFSDDNTTVPGTNATHYFTRPGIFNVQLINTYGGCYDTVTKAVTVVAGLAVSGFLADKTSSCKAPLTVNFEDTTTGAVKWHWNFGTGNAADTANTRKPSFTFTQNRNYTVTLTVTNLAGCQTTVTKNINISPLNVTIGYTKSNSVHGLYGCPGLSIKFKSFPEGSIKAFRWDFGDGGTATTAEPEHTFNDIGNYTVKLYYTTNAGCEDSVVYTNYVRTYRKPVVEFESLSGLSICGNTPVRFADRTDTATRWRWDFGDGGTSTEQNPTHSYSAEGDFSVTLIATNQYCSDTLVKEQFIKLTPPFPSISGVVKDCNNRGRLTLKQTSVGAKKWEWNFGDGSPTETYTTDRLEVTHTYTKSGVYKVFLYTSNDQCTTYDTMYVSVLVKQKPIITADKSSLCGSDTLNVTVTGLDPIQYYHEPSKQVYTYPYTGRWVYSDGTVHSQTSSSWQPPQFSQGLTRLRPGRDSIRLITYDGVNGCYDTSNYISLTVSGPVAGFTKDAAIKCARALVSFTDTSKGTGGVPIRQWIWNFGDGTRDTLTTGGTISHSYVQPGYYFPSLKVVDAAGCYAETGANSNQVTIYGPLADFYTLDTAVSPNQPVRFVNITNTWPGYPVTYTWDFGDGNRSSQFAPTHRYTKTGYYTVKLVAKSSFGCTDSLVRETYIEVKTVKSAFKVTSSYVNNNSCPPLLARFENVSVNADSVFWDFGDLSYADNVRTPNHTYFQPGVYTVYLYAFGKGGVVDTAVQQVTVNGPYGTVEPDKLQGCVPTEFTLTAHAKNAISYTWDFGDGNVAQGNDTTSVHTYNNAGIYRPRVIMRDAAGCSASFRVKDSIIIDKVEAAFNPSQRLICDEATVQFSSNVYNFSNDSLDTPIQYSWNFGTGNAKDTSNEAGARFYYNKPGKYAVTFSATSAYGCTQTITDTITVLQKPAIAVSAQASVCAQDSVQFGAAANMTGLQWHWNFGNGETDTVQRPAARAFNQPGTFDVQVIAFNDPACADTSVSSLVVNGLPKIDLSPRDTLICRGDTITLRAHDGATYAWTSNSTLPQRNMPVINVSPVQNAFYKVKVTTAAGCAAEDSLTVTVSQPFDVAVKPNDITVCAGTIVPLQAEGAVGYQWLPADGLSNGSAANPLARPAQTTTYQVVGYGADQCFTDTADVRISIVPLPEVSAGNDTTVQVGSVVTLRAITSPDVTKVLWSPAEYLSCTDCKTPLSALREPMEYTVSVSNSFGCVATDTVKVHLQCANSVVFIPNTFTPNGDGVNDVFYPRGVGIKSVRYFRIFDRWGELIFEKGSFPIDDKRSGWDGTFRGKPLPTGVFVYTTEMICDNGEVFTLKGSIMIVR